MPEDPMSELDAVEAPELVQCIYMSAAIEAFDADALTALLAEARRANARAGLSGMLLYAGGSFFQVLEGPASAVDALFARIQTDPRHDSIVRLVREPIKERAFEDWTMGFYAVSEDEIPSVPGLNDFLNTRPACPAEPGTGSAGRAHALLAAFRSGKWRRKINA